SFDSASLPGELEIIPNQTKKNLDYLPAGNPSEPRRAEPVRPPTVFQSPASETLVA
ncbi:hypothetical protein GOODEAATRI_021402, partial [Goodea atripinnis]